MYNAIYPNYFRTYAGVNNKQTASKQEGEKDSRSSEQTENNLRQEEELRSNSRSNGQNKALASVSYFPNGEKVAIDYTKKQIHIEQVLSDFKNTANAIGAPDDIKNEVNSYLKLIQSQSYKENPNKKIIQADLKNASQILDEYITNTLKKPSNVVENWVDALFLQQIDYKSQKPAVLQSQQTEKSAAAEIADKSQSASNTSVLSEEQSAAETARNYDIYVPSDLTLKRMFIQAKKYAAIDQKEKALYAFQNTMDYAQEIGDDQTSAMIHYEQGCLYDEFNRIEDALYNYDKAARQSSDNNIKAKAHIYMGKIYDDYVILEPAADHYSAAVSFSGESDNLKLQTQALSNLAKIHTEQYDRDNAMMFMDMSSTIAEETGDNRVKGIINNKNAKLCEKLSEKAQALNYYGTAAEAFSQNSDDENLAKNYKNAAEIMLGYGNGAKAKTLLSKAYIAAYKTDNDELKTEITQQIAAL